MVRKLVLPLFHFISYQLGIREILKDSKVTFGTLEKEVLPDKIVDRLLTLIKDRQLEPGDRLPPERELAVTMGVSRPSLRAALRALAVMNVIEIRQGSGAYITALEPQQLMAHLDFVFSLNDSTFLQLFDARRIIEVGIAALAGPADHRSGTGPTWKDVWTSQR